jgi:hypothetical protein
VTDLCAGYTAQPSARERIFAWLAEGAREVSWALCTLPRERWTAQPPVELGPWPVLRHARHLVLREQHLTLPAVRSALDGALATEPPAARAAFETADAAWDARSADADADALVRGLGETRFELLKNLESAPDAAWQAPRPENTDSESSAAPIRLDTLLLRARQHELEHLADIWRVALYWDRPAPTSMGSVDLPFHPADRFSEGVTRR